MKPEELEKKLNMGEMFGFIKETNDPNYLGWILLRKRLVPPSLPDPREKEKYLRWEKQMETWKKEPYDLSILELRREVHESGEYESTEDYRLREHYYFSTLEETERKIKELGFNISGIKSSREIDAP